MITISAFVPESGIMLARPSPRLLATPAIVRAYGLELKSSAASTSSCSSGERRRSTGCETTGSGACGLLRSKSPEKPPSRWRRLRGASVTIGCVGVPSLTHPYSFAWSRQSGQTSTHSSLPGVGA